MPDDLANASFTLGGFATAFIWKSAWHEFIVGCGICTMNIDAAKEVWEIGRGKQDAVVA